MSIPEIDIDAFTDPEHAMIACARAAIKHFGEVTRIKVRVERYEGEWQEYSIGDKAREID